MEGTEFLKVAELSKIFIENLLDENEKLRKQNARLVEALDYILNEDSPEYEQVGEIKQLLMQSRGMGDVQR